MDRESREISVFYNLQYIICVTCTAIYFKAALKNSLILLGILNKNT